MCVRSIKDYLSGVVSKREIVPETRMYRTTKIVVVVATPSVRDGADAGMIGSTSVATMPFS